MKISYSVTDFQVQLNIFSIYISQCKILWNATAEVTNNKTNAQDIFLDLVFNLTTTGPVMPAKATLFDLKCEPLFDFGTGPRNEVFYNPQGNNILTH